AGARPVTMPSAAQANVMRRCAALASVVAFPEKGTRITSTMWHEAGAVLQPSRPGAAPLPPVDTPPHCEITGLMHERKGVDGQTYAIKFHLRLPDAWNGRFFMMGGGGSNGELGDALGRLGGEGQAAITQGYAVLSQDSGHDNATNTVAARNGLAAFGFDPQARADYGGVSLAPVVHAARAIVRARYGVTPRKSYFMGCSKGGQEGMMLAQRYPDLFDGIIAAAPGFALPKAAVAEAWNTQAFSAVVRASGQNLTPEALKASFSDNDFQLVGQAVLNACDKDDGVADGMVSAWRMCTSAKVQRALSAMTCTGGKNDTCLMPAQVEALRKVNAGTPTYPGFPFDPGWSAPGWRMWMIGMGPIPAINLAMGAPSLASVFSVPPRALAEGQQAALDYHMGFDATRDAHLLFDHGGGFARSAWADVGARSPNLDAFRRRGGRLIVPHGLADPVFSFADTAAWYDAVNARYRGGAEGFVRVFAVPGMNHCGGGPAADGYDAFAALTDWVEKGRAPAQMVATAGPAAPWPGRTRLLCAYPRQAFYKGGDVEKASSFACR
ncbi:MAG TPA: tannase/feruloyl esterase family alpha/beta hydrolase, partial [Novosphingobium sp.]|nr:tannase/feruloyl esterase family alpha/beta hydrolase [Novosphingobium sp.]